MFCTGGIRCEKSTAFVKSRGFEEVYHLKGGILKYLESVPEEESKWHGECFVFDQRVAVGHGLAAGQHTLCHACRMPASPEDRARSEEHTSELRSLIRSSLAVLRFNNKSATRKHAITAPQ